MLNIGFSELVIICIVLIIAVGPERLPSMMKTLGKTMRTLRQASRDIRASTGIDELMREDFDLEAPLRRPLAPPAGPERVSRDEPPLELATPAPPLADAALTMPEPPAEAIASVPGAPAADRSDAAQSGAPRADETGRQVFRISEPPPSAAAAASSNPNNGAAARAPAESAEPPAHNTTAGAPAAPKAGEG